MKMFNEKMNIIVDTFTTGSTTARYTKFYDMQKYRRVDFLVTGIVKTLASGAGGGTDYQNFTIAAYQATDSTGGGASAISSATAVLGKDSASGISTSMQCRDGYINFSTLTSAVPIDISVGTALFTCATVTAAANQCAVASAAAATAACQAFVTMFNSTAENTATVITANWVASTEGAGVPWVRISPRNPESTYLLRLGTTGSSQVAVGGVFTAHIGLDQQYLSKRYVGLSIKSTEHANAYVVHVIREAIDGPTTSVSVRSKTLNTSTSK